MIDNITVYNYYGFSITKGANINHRSYATMEFIQRNRLTAVEEDKLEVSRTDLDPDGRYILKEAKP